MSQASAPAIPVDLSEEQFGIGIPFETFAALRASQPVYWYEPGNCWVVTSYEHVEKINRDPGRFSSAGGPIPPDDPGHPELPIMLADDPPEHTVYRRLVNKDWTPRAIMTRGGLVESVVNDVVSAFRDAGAGDFIRDVAGPIPFRIIATMVGIPARAVQSRAKSEAFCAYGLAGHELPDIETVIERAPEYVIVEKRDTAGQAAAAADPRS